MSSFLLRGTCCTLRPWLQEDISRCAELANNYQLVPVSFPTNFLAFLAFYGAVFDPANKMLGNGQIWKNLLDEFPHPYTERDAASWIRLSQDPPFKYTNLAICIQNELDENKLDCIGGIAVSPTGQSICKKRVKMLGYWLGEPYWGKGIATEAVQLITDYAFSEEYATLANDGAPVARIEAGIFAYNTPSGRVLQKNGFHLEAVQPCAYFKEGVNVDCHLYVKLNPQQLK